MKGRTSLKLADWRKALRLRLLLDSTVGCLACPPREVERLGQAEATLRPVGHLVDNNDPKLARRPCEPARQDAEGRHR